MTLKALVTALTVSATALTAATQTATAATKTTTYELVPPEIKIFPDGDATYIYRRIVSCPKGYVPTSADDLPEEVKAKAQGFTRINGKNVSLLATVYSRLRKDLSYETGTYACLKKTTTTSVGTGLGGTQLGWALPVIGATLLLAFTSSSNNTTSTTGTGNN